MNRRNLGILVTVLGSAMCAWYWTRRRSSSHASLTPARDAGTVIFDNTPVASAEGVI